MASWPRNVRFSALSLCLFCPVLLQSCERTANRKSVVSVEIRDMPAFEL